MWFLLASVAILSVLVLAYFERSWKYWKVRNVEFPQPSFPFGNVKDLFIQKKTFGEMMTGFYDDFKKKKLSYAGFYFMSSPNLVITDLNLIKTIMTKDFQYFTDRSNFVNKKDPLSGHLFSLKGQKWRNLRVKLTPTFTSGKMKMMFPILVECSRGLCQLMDQCVENTRPFNIKNLVARYTTDVIGSAAFGIDCDSLNNPDSEFRKYGAKIFNRTFLGTVKVFFSLTAPEVLKFFNVQLVRKDVSDFFINVVNETVKYRETNDVKRNDFMQLLIQLKKGEGESATDGSASLTMNELAAQAFVFFVAGFETSSTTLTFCFYELAQNLELQQKLREEVNDVLQKHNFELSYDAINEMTYMDKCISETLRKYPPVPVLNRKCTESYKLADTDLVIEKGTTVHIPVLGIHRDPDVYPDPMTFDPERFSQENKAQRHQYAWLPFGEGPRICIGMRFGLMQTKVALAVLIKNYTYTLSDKTSVPLVLNPKLLLMDAKEGVWLNAKKIE